MLLIAHRGLTNEFIKENTISSFQNALDNKYDGIELDIRYTKDKKIVIHHDYLINRTSNKKGKLNSYTYKELKKINFGTKKRKEKIPLLIEVIKKFNNTIMFIELKEDIGIELLEILKLNKTNKYYICSFNEKYINKFYKSNYNIGIINNVFNSNIDLKKINFIMILENIFNENIYNKLINKNIEIVIYGTLNNINIKNKEILNKIKYII